MINKWAGRTLVAAALFSAGFLAVAAASPQPVFLWNATASAPLGLYLIDRVKDARPDELVAIMPPPAMARYLSDRHYLPRGTPLIKHVAARAGARVCRFGSIVTINDRPVAAASDRDSKGHPLPVWSGCKQISPDKLFLLNAHPDSLDGRYFGPMPRAGLIGTAHPLLTRAAPDEPLAWRPRLIFHLSNHPEQE